MKIRFLDLEMSKAIITKGFWWWKRQAEVERYGTQTQYGEYSSWTVDGWRFVISKQMLLGDDCASLNNAAKSIKHQTHDQLVWSKMSKAAPLPPARLLKE